jgi:pimeloyl-ACP methyl ester carboxylesterase
VEHLLAGATRLPRMRGSVRKIAGVILTTLVASVCAWATAAAAQAQIAFTPCGASNEFACGHLTVPLDPSGASAGTITLAIRRHRAAVGEEKSAVIALAGGPGQAALPFAEQFTSELGPIVATRDLIVFDQRGIGLSHPLSCHRFESTSPSSAFGPGIAECAAQMGPMRSFFTTADSVADIEAIRVAGGYEKLVLYGTSYGTKLAEEYAQDYPSHVEALVLDSVVPPNGPDPLNRATFASIPRILTQLCAHRACAHITRNPTADLANLVRRLGNGVKHGRWIDGHGHSHRIAISSEALLEALLAGDLEPTLRSEVPAAVRAAAHGDMAALARLLERGGSNSEEDEPESPDESFNTPLYYATTCEESLFPWSRAAAPKQRLAEATAAIDALGPRAFAPFTESSALELSDMPACAFWPFTTPAPLTRDAPFPSVPTLILSGTEDLRTPTANAREVAAEIPGSKLLVVPNVGHSVLGDDPTNCSLDALRALFAKTPIKDCAGAPSPPLLSLTPLPPARLSDVAPAHGNQGKPGRTLEAVLDTLADFDHQLALRALAELSAGNLSGGSSLSVGGLRSGWAGLTNGKIILHGYCYVPGVTVSGEISDQRIALNVSGRSAARGSLLANLTSDGPEKILSGVLEGRQVSVSRSDDSASGAQAAPAELHAMGDALSAASRSRGDAASERAHLRAVLSLRG